MWNASAAAAAFGSASGDGNSFDAIANKKIPATGKGNSHFRGGAPMYPQFGGDSSSGWKSAKANPTQFSQSQGFGSGGHSTEGWKGNKAAQGKSFVPNTGFGKSKSGDDSIGMNPASGSQRQQTNTRQDHSSSSDDWRTSRANFQNSSHTQGQPKAITCFVCQKIFSSFPELKEHIRTEGHHSSAVAGTTVRQGADKKFTGNPNGNGPAESTAPSKSPKPWQRPQDIKTKLDVSSEAIRASIPSPKRAQGAKAWGSKISSQQMSNESKRPAGPTNVGLGQHVKSSDSAGQSSLPSASLQTPPARSPRHSVKDPKQKELELRQKLLQAMPRKSTNPESTPKKKGDLYLSPSPPANINASGTEGASSKFSDLLGMFAGGTRSHANNDARLPVSKLDYSPDVKDAAKVAANNDGAFEDREYDSGEDYYNDDSHIGSYDEDDDGDNTGGDNYDYNDDGYNEDDDNGDDGDDNDSYHDDDRDDGDSYDEDEVDEEDEDAIDEVDEDAADDEDDFQDDQGDDGDYDSDEVADNDEDENDDYEHGGDSFYGGDDDNDDRYDGGESENLVTPVEIGECPAGRKNEISRADLSKTSSNIDRSSASVLSRIGGNAAGANHLVPERIPTVTSRNSSASNPDRNKVEIDICGSVPIRSVRSNGLALDIKDAGSCEEMCPAEERSRRETEFDIHRLELILYPKTVTDAITQLKDHMIKKFQRSSADHELKIPHLIRTPLVLLKTIRYIEDSISDLHKLRSSADDISALFVYLFIWDRYRMIAKDFILQSTVLPKDILWVECVERMARWYILMDHRMRQFPDYVGGHAQQNLESLNNLLKTLNGYYRNQAILSTPEASQLVRNHGEFAGYYLLVQLANTGVVTKYLQTLPDFVLSSDPVKFAIRVRAAFSTDNYVRFFQLLSEGSPLQAGLMVTYVNQVRMVGIRTISRSLSKGAYFPISLLCEILKFEDLDEAKEFLASYGIDVEMGEEDEGLCAVLGMSFDPSIVSTFKTKCMLKGIESRLIEWSTAQICRGFVSSDTIFDDATLSLVPNCMVNSQPRLAKLAVSADVTLRDSPVVCSETVPTANVSVPITVSTKTTSNQLPPRHPLSPVVASKSIGLPPTKLPDGLKPSTSPFPIGNLKPVTPEVARQYEDKRQVGLIPEQAKMTSISTSASNRLPPSSSSTVTFPDSSASGTGYKPINIQTTNIAPNLAEIGESSQRIYHHNAFPIANTSQSHFQHNMQIVDLQRQELQQQQQQQQPVILKQQGQQALHQDEQEIIKQRKGEEQAKLQAEKERLLEEKLRALEDRVSSRNRVLSLRLAWRFWYREAISKISFNSRKCMAIRFLKWKQIFQLRRKRRIQLLSEIQSILPVQRITSPIRRRYEKLSLLRVLPKTISGTKSAQITPLNEVNKYLSQTFGSVSSCQSSFLSVLGRSLFISQCRAVRHCYGYADSETFSISSANGPTWNQKLFFKLLICSDIELSGGWSESDDIFPNLVRSLLCNQIFDTLPANKVGFWDRPTDCLLRTNGSSIQRNVSVCIRDISMRYAIPRDSLDGCQGGLFFLPSDVEAWNADSRQLKHALLHCIATKAPIVFIFSSIGKVSLESLFCSRSKNCYFDGAELFGCISRPDANTNNSLEKTRYLVTCALERSGIESCDIFEIFTSISGAFLISNGNESDNGTFDTAVNCIQVALSNLTCRSCPFPLVRKLDTRSWLREVQQEVISRTQLVCQLPSGYNQQLGLEYLFLLILSNVNLALSECRKVVGNALIRIRSRSSQCCPLFPAGEFATEGIVPGALFDDAVGIDRFNYLPIDWDIDELPFVRALEIIDFLIVPNVGFRVDMTPVDCSNLFAELLKQLSEIGWDLTNTARTLSLVQATREEFCIGKHQLDLDQARVCRAVSSLLEGRFRQHERKGFSSDNIFLLVHEADSILSEFQLIEPIFGVEAQILKRKAMHLTTSDVDEFGLRSDLVHTGDTESSVLEGEPSTPKRSRSEFATIFQDSNSELLTKMKSEIDTVQQTERRLEKLLRQALAPSDITKLPPAKLVTPSSKLTSEQALEMVAKCSLERSKFELYCKSLM